MPKTQNRYDAWKNLKQIMCVVADILDEKTQEALLDALHDYERLSGSSWARAMLREIEQYLH